MAGARITGPGARLAELLVAEEAQTPFGGWSRTLEPVGWAWVRPRAGVWDTKSASRTEDGQAWAVETLELLTRPDGTVRAGRVLRLDGTDWEITEVVPDGSQLRLELQRLRRERGV